LVILVEGRREVADGDVDVVPRVALAPRVVAPLDIARIVQPELPQDAGVFGLVLLEGHPPPPTGLPSGVVVVFPPRGAALVVDVGKEHPPREAPPLA